MAGMIPRFTDELLRPIVALALSAAGIAKLIVDEPTRNSALIWTLTIVVIAFALATIPPWTRVPQRAQVLLLLGFVVSGGILFPFSPATGASDLLFVAATTAGERLGNRRTALTLAGVGTVVACLSTLFLAHAGEPLGQSPWWLVLTTWLPVYIGISRSDRAAALASAEIAARERSRATEAELRAAALDERGRIARDIHDVLGHSLSGIAMQLDMADALHSSARDDEANAAVHRARAMAVSGLTETRRAVHALRDGAVPLQRALAEMAEAGGVTFTGSGLLEVLPVETGQTIIRTAQEAITNARRHAAGAEITMTLDIDDRVVRLVVSDTGADPVIASPAAAGRSRRGESGGMGLVGMRERAALLGGTVDAGPTADTAPGASAAPGHRPGWIVRMELPR